MEQRTYDASGNLLLCIMPEQAEEEKGFSYTYDLENRLIAVTNPEGAVEKWYMYDLAGRVVKEVEAAYIQEGNGEAEPSGILYQYDALGRLLERRTPVRTEEEGEIRYQLVQYQYDKSGNRTRELRYREEQTETGSLGRTHLISYQYDAANRL